MSDIATEFEQIDNTTFKIAEGVRSTIVGDEKKSVFEPTIEIRPWEDKEDCLKVYKDISASVGISVDLTDMGNLVWRDNQEAWTIQPFQKFKPVGIKSAYRLWNGAQFLIRVNEKPKIDPDGYVRFHFKLSGHEDMEFWLQPGEGHPESHPSDPDWYKDSIAVYHKTKRDVRRSAITGQIVKTYKTGKVCHILRPWCINSVGNFTWGHWEIDIPNAIITKCIPESAFNTGLWWVVDATFGNTAQGGSTGGWVTDDNIIGTAEGHSPAEDGTADSCTAWVTRAGGAARNNQMNLYDESDESQITGAQTAEVSVGTGDQELEFTYGGSGPSVLSATSYTIVIWGDAAGGDVEVYSDFISSAGQNEANSNYNVWDDPWSPGVANRRFSLYCTYTAGDGDLSIDVSDGIGLSESIGPAEDLGPASVSDVLTLSELLTLLMNLGPVSVSDSFALSEVLAALTDIKPNVFDTITLGEFVNVLKSVLEVSVSDSFNLAELTDLIFSDLEINLSDTIDLNEVVTVLKSILEIDISDGMTLTEYINVVVESVEVYHEIDISDSMTLTESLTLIFSNLMPSVNDPIALSESIVTRMSYILASISDGIALTDLASATVSGDITLSILDSFTLSEVITLIFSGLGISVSDAIGLTESLVMSLSINLSVSDTLALAESVEAGIPIAPSIVDYINLVESVLLSKDIIPSLSESIGLSESLTVSLTTIITIIGKLNVAFTSSKPRVGFTSKKPGVSITGAKPYITFTGE